MTKQPGMLGGLPQLGQPMPAQDALHHSLLFLRRRWVSILTWALLGLALSLLIISRIEPLFKSSALLMIERPRASPLDEENVGAVREQSAFLDGQIFVFYAADTLMEVRRAAALESDPEFLASPPGLLMRIAAMFMPDALPQTADQRDAAALRKLREALYVRREGDSNVVNISVSTTLPQKSARVANSFVDTYIAQRQSKQLEQAAKIAAWTEDRALQIKRQLSEAEEAAAEFRAKNGLIEGIQGGTLGNQQLFELNAELIRVRTELASRRAAFDQATFLVDNGGDLQTLPELQNSEIVVALRTELLGLQRRVSDLIQQSGKGDRRVGPLQEQILGVDEQIQREVRRIIAAIGNEANTLVAREVLLTKSVSEAGGKSGLDSQAAVTLRELERVAESYRELYQPYLANISLAQEGGSLLASGTEIISRATPPIDPSYPPKKVIVLLLTLLGAGFGALLGLLREWMHQGFVTVGQVEAILGLPVLNCLPILSRKERAMDIVQTDPFSPYAEAIRVVRKGLLEKTNGVANPVVLITSAGTGEGKTSISTALGASAHSLGQNVLLIDADFRRAGLSRFFEATDDTGISDILLSPRRAYDFAPEKGATALDVLPVGTARMQSAKLLNGPGFERFIESVRNNYDLIVIDGPPVANLADAAILAQVCDAVAFVVRWQTTPRESAKQALRRLPPENLAGVVLNGIDPDAMANYGEIYDRYVPVLISDAAA